MGAVTIIQFGTITLKLFSDGRAWLEQPDGEGTEVSQAEIERYLQQCFKKNM